MSNLIIHRATGLVKPNGMLRVNWASDLSNGLKHAFMCERTGMRDLVTGTWYAANGGTGCVSAWGIGWQSDGSGYIDGPSGTTANVTGNYSTGTGVSCIVAGKFSNSGTPNAAPLANSYKTASGGWTLKSEQYNNTNQVGFGSWGAGLDYTSGITTPSDDGSVISLQMQAGGTTKYRVNAVSTGSSANATPSNTGDQITVGGGWRNSSINDPLYSGDRVYWAAIYNLDLPDEQMFRWHTRPFGDIIVRDTPRTYFFANSVAAGGGGSTTNYLGLLGVGA